MGWMPIKFSPFAVKFGALSEEQAERNHSQSLRRLAERGGVTPREAYALAKEVKWIEVRSLSEEEALERLFEMAQNDI